MRRKYIIVAADILAVIISYGLSLLLRFDLAIFDIPEKYISGYIFYAAVSIFVTLVVYKLFKLYQSIWTYVGINEIIYTFAGSIVSAIVSAALTVWKVRMPLSFYLFGWILMFFSTCFVRLSYRLARRLRGRYAGHNTNRHNIMIVGAGAAAAILIKEYRTSGELTDKVRCLIDDNPNKRGRILEGIPVVGDRNDIAENVKKYHIDRIIIAMPSVKQQTIKELVEICQYTGCHVQKVPGVYQLVNEEVSVSNLKDVDIEDLLGRDPIRMDIEEILGYVKDQIVLVTGGGGSIGSELCRQLAAHKVKELIIFEMYENNAYDIQQELKYKYPDLKLTVLIGSVRNSNRLESVFKTYRPDIVYHAAAHKHVPLMEDSPNEAIKNNVIGTYKTAMRADKYKVKRFVLISTDKAVNPTNIMGASKRLCEMVIQMFAQKSETIFTAVRFGNVLGSNGSVIPLFKKQIAHGGPVTVTHKDIIRYFMTIPEAVSLVLQAGAYAKGGEIFVLDMGEPVKIADLAENLIRLSGYTPDVDIKIEYTGLRPGEKLYEELLMAEEGLKKTANDRIFIGNPLPVDADKLKSELSYLERQAWNECSDMKELVRKIVPEYKAGQVW